MMLEVFKKYSQDFEELIDTAFRASRQAPLPYRKAHLSILYSTLFYLELKDQVLRAEIKNELAYLWLQYIRSFEKTQPKVTLKTYLIRMSLWGLRDWFKKKTHAKLVPIPQPPIEEDFGFTLDLSFLIYGTDYRGLDSLTPYERYLIFLKFKEEKTIIEIAEFVQKDKDTVNKHIHETMEKIRILSNENK